MPASAPLNPRITLANEEIVVEIAPDEGGRIVSLRSVRTGVEFLTQARRVRPPVLPGLQASFADGPCAGAEECLPTVAASVDREGKPAPDHGDFWQIPWSIDACGPKELRMHALGFSLPLCLERDIQIQGSRLEMNYRATNVGAESVSFLYAWHPLFAVDPGDRVVLPAEVHAVRLAYSRNARFAPLGKEVAWPTGSAAPAEDIDLSVALAPDAGAAEMLYTGRLASGRCGLFRAVKRQGVIVSFDTSRLPFLGLWLCFGGWPEGGDQPKQVAIALEPTVAPCGALAKAEAEGMAPRLAPGTTVEWSIGAFLSAPNLSHAEFTSSVHREH